MRKIFTFILLIAFHCSFSQWNSNSAFNTAVCTSATQQNASRMVTDGNGGTIVAWWDYNASISDYNIYAQRINANGVVQWTAGGVPICTNSQHQQNPEMTSDGVGGAIIVWQDNRSGNCEIYAQKIDASGVVQWTTDGVSVGEATNCQTFPQAISDGAGGAFVTWKDLRNGSSYRIYTQRINAIGINQWGAGGVSMSIGTNEQGEPQIVSDGAGGMIVSWQEFIGPNATGQYDVYAQRVDANGTVLWGTNGSVICAALNFQQRTQLTTDGSNGAIIVWQDSRTAGGVNTYAQRVNAVGVVQWTTDGIALGPTGVTQTGQRIISDGSGGAFVAWRNGNSEIYSQHITSTGSLLWTATGLRIIAASNAIDPQLATDGSTGILITWSDYRNTNPPNIFAQRVNSAGSFLWVAAGVNVSSATLGQIAPQIVAGPGGTAIIDWIDFRNDAGDIYASKLNPDGTLSSAVLPVTLIAFEAKRSNNRVQLNWKTVSEQNSHSFSVERSNNGTQFNSIGTVLAAGNSASVKNYSFTDSLPFDQTNYYRLKQTDADGKFAYSPVISIKNSSSEIIFSISPNPSHHFINITSASKKEIIEIRIYNSAGVLSKQQSIRNQLNIQVDIQDLKPGIYFISLQDATVAQNGKFIKQ